MTYTIDYNGIMDRESLSLVSAVGGSNLEIGDTITAAFGSGLGYWVVNIAEERKNEDGFIYWEDIFGWSPVSVSGETVVETYIVPDIPEIKVPNTKQFFRFKFYTTVDYEVNLSLSTENERLAHAFISDKAPMLSPTVARVANFNGTEQKNVSLFMNRTSSGGDNYIVSLVNGGGGSHLKWYQTNDPNYLSTYFYIKNPTYEPMSFNVSLQGQIKTITGNASWLSPTEDEKVSNYLWTYEIVKVESQKTKMIEFCVRNFGTLQHPYCKIWDGEKYINVGFSSLFWRINTYASGYYILDEQVMSDAVYNNLVDIFYYGSYPNGKVTKIIQDIEKTP